MRFLFTKYLALVIGAILVLITLFFIFFQKKEEIPTPMMKEEIAVETSPKETLIGKSVEGRPIKAYSYGSGKTKLLFVGGMHGGYEWNSVLLAHLFMDYLKDTPSSIPVGLLVEVIPSLNPDGLFMVTGKEGRFDIKDVSTSTKVLEGARFNANKVDLNRNFDCMWQPKSTWRKEAVSAGTKAFSEPEAVALRDYILDQKPRAVIFWHSQANAVYASQCDNGILPVTLNIMNAYATASKYHAVEIFNSYEITGDAGDWLSKIGIPAITVELQTHETIEWERNLAGIKALFLYFSQNNN